MADITRLPRNARTELSTGSTAYARLSRFLIPASTFPVSTSVRLPFPSSPVLTRQPLCLCGAVTRPTTPSALRYNRPIHPTCVRYAWTITCLRARTADSSRHACAIPPLENFAAVTLNYAKSWCTPDALIFLPWRREIKDGCEQQYRKRMALYVFAHCPLVHDCLFTRDVLPQIIRSQNRKF